METTIIIKEGLILETQPKQPIIRQLTASTIPQIILDANPKRKACLIYNNGAQAVYLNSSKEGTVDTGIPIAASGSYNSNLFDCTGTYWVISTANTDLRIEEDMVT